MSANGLVQTVQGLLNGSSKAPEYPLPDSRPLTISHPATNSRLTIQVKEVDYTSADILKDAFLYYQEQDADARTAFAQDEVDQTAEEGDQELPSVVKAQREILLLALFMRFIAAPARSHAAKNSRAKGNLSVLYASLLHFTVHFLEARKRDIHALASEFDNEQRRVLIRCYYEAKIALEESTDYRVPQGPISLLFTQETERPTIQALFGGQGMNEVYFNELQALYNLYAPLINTFLSKASAVLSALAAKHSDSLSYAHSLQPLAWLISPDARPSVPYLASCAVSLPLIGVTQIAQYVVTARILGFSPAQMRAKFAGATGHSQGIVAAAFIARKLEKDTWEAFIDASASALTVLFYIGYRGSEAFPTRSVAPSLINDCVEKGEGVPTTMLAVTGLARQPLEKKIKETNEHLSVQGKGTVQISLFNGLKAFVVTGPPASLVGLVTQLRKNKAESGKDQSKIPYSKRLPVFSVRFLPIGVPYHSPYLEGCTDKLARDLGSAAHQWKVADLDIPVYHTEDGHDLRTSDTSNLAVELADQVFSRPIHWVKATTYEPHVKHVIDFGTGGNSGIGSLVAREQEGTGIRVLFASGGTAGRGNEEVYRADKVRYDSRWQDKYRPKLLRTSDGRIHLDTPFSRLLSKPPLMVAGMTPSTVQAGFNAATLNAGYHIELAGGGHYNEKALRAKVAEISAQLKTPGLGITLNSLYINQRQWTYQFPLWCRMRQEGLPIEGFCVAAGIPSTEKAVEIIGGLREAGIKHVSFKPGSVEGIRQVINIAASNPDFPIIMQWTGGRAGGHHSCEDFHQPILAAYGSIRQYSNLILVGGSGFGGAEDIWPYLTGEWSVKYGVQPMPYDGFLFASRVMVAKEAHTSPSVKQLIVDCPGVDDSQWEQTYDKPTGGILTVTSELGEPIHKVANRAIKLWREFDDTVFALPKEKRAAWLKEKKDYVIKRLNADFQKPWFAQKADGHVCDVEEMTYAETIDRMVRLMYVKHEKRWIDRSLRNLVGDWIRRVEERLAGGMPNSTSISELQSFAELEEPFSFLERFYARYSLAQKQILASTDARYFLAICQRPGQKPVPFIPVLDATFGVWFKKDSLWQAEDIEAVFDQDPQRVCILQGPVAVKHSKRTDEPIKELLGNVERGLISRVLETYYDRDEAQVPQEAYLARPPPSETRNGFHSPDNTYGLKYSSSEGPDGTTIHIYDISETLPPTGEWVQHLAGPKAGWLRAFLTSVSVVQGPGVTANQASSVFKPRPNQKVKIITDAAGNPLKLEVFGGIRTPKQP